MTELFHNLGLPWHPCPLPESGLEEEEVPEVEQMVPQKPTREQPGPLAGMQPTMMAG